MTLFMLWREGMMSCDGVIFWKNKRCFENSLGSHTVSVWCDFYAIGFLEKRAMLMKVYKSFENKNFEG